ncbi:MAG: hypothetical protein G8237_11470 [Magnetococcales bacterium]|nr:hypothetical protein [Magnetococcales bacterium]
MSDSLGSSDRAFGLVFAALFAGISAWLGLTGTGGFGWALLLSVVLLTIAWHVPHWLAPCNRLWTRFGLVLHRVVNPLVMGVIFFVVITPFALFFRLTGRDLLHRRFRPGSQSSYWIPRNPPGPDPATMKYPF